MQSVVLVTEDIAWEDVYFLPLETSWSLSSEDITFLSYHRNPGLWLENSVVCTIVLVHVLAYSRLPGNLSELFLKRSKY